MSILLVTNPFNVLTRRKQYFTKDDNKCTNANGNSNAHRHFDSFGITTALYHSSKNQGSVCTESFECNRNQLDTI